MTKYLFLLLAFLSLRSAHAQKNDPELLSRLDAYMRLSRELKFDQVMDYTHPSIFALMPREQLVEVSRQAFDNNYFRITLDSLRTTNISADFVVAPARYKKITYRMVARVVFKDTSMIKDQAMVDKLMESFRNSFDGAQVKYDTVMKSFEIRASTLMIAIKDDATKPWMFLGYQKDANLLTRLYPQSVIDHFKLL